MLVSRLTLDHRDEFLRMLEDYDLLDPENGASYESGREDFASYVQKQADDEQGVNLEPNRVPCTHLWLFENNEIVAICRVRHNVETDFLRDEGGHIGYDVPPSHRDKRYGIAALAAGLQHAKDIGLHEVLVFADAHNQPSWRTIERCGGVRLNERYSTFYNCIVYRYRINLSSEPSTQKSSAL